MMTSHWDADCNAPCCAGRIIADNGRDILIQTDWDWPGLASTFGWSVRYVQRCAECGSEPDSADGAEAPCDDCDTETAICSHDGTDGTVDCSACGVSVSEFISAAGDFLDGVDGAVADDPGYFDGRDG